jgi:hypothetical protein
VLIPTLIDRTDEFSGRPDIAMTNQPHREWIWRQAYEMGRHIIGYEVQKVLAAVDWLKTPGAKLPVGVVGYGEGGLSRSTAPRSSRGSTPASSAAILTRGRTSLTSRSIATCSDCSPSLVTRRSAA